MTCPIACKWSDQEKPSRKNELGKELHEKLGDMNAQQGNRLNSFEERLLRLERGPTGSTRLNETDAGANDEKRSGEQIEVGQRTVRLNNFQSMSCPQVRQNIEQHVRAVDVDGAGVEEIMVGREGGNFTYRGEVQFTSNGGATKSLKAKHAEWRVEGDVIYNGRDYEDRPTREMKFRARKARKAL